MDRLTATPVLKKIWKSIDKFDRLYTETGDPNHLVQLEGMKAQCKRIMKLVKKNESSK